MAVKSVFLCLYLSVSTSSCFGHIVQPQDFFKEFTQATPLRYVINITNCLSPPPFGPKFEGTYISDVISGGSLSSGSDASWEMSVSSEKLIDGRRYNLSTPALRVTSIPMSDQGQAYVYIYDLDPRSLKRLAVQDYTCFTGQMKSEIAFVTTNQTKTPLYTYDDVIATLRSGGEITFSFNVAGGSQDQFSYIVGRISNFNLVHDDIVFGIGLPDELWTTVYNARLSPDSRVVLKTFQVNRKSKTSDNTQSSNGTITEEGYYRMYKLT